MLPQNLAPSEVRVLGALIEKALSTPDHYPLSLNALVSACNQVSNRDPVTSLTDTEVSAAIDVLRRQSLVRSFQGSGERVPKYQHLLADTEGLSSVELAVLCVLALRGPQTLGEIRSRAARLMPGDGPDGVEAALDVLAVCLPRRPGQKEARYAHRLGGDILHEEKEDVAGPVPASSADRITALEELTMELRSDVTDLRAQLEAFRKQFE